LFTIKKPNIFHIYLIIIELHLALSKLPIFESFDKGEV